MERRGPIPPALGISWWWLLVFAAVEAELNNLLKIPGSFAIASVLPLWFVAQSAWLWRLAGRGRALYCTIAWVIGFSLLGSRLVTARLLMLDGPYVSVIFYFLVGLPLILYVTGSVFLLRDLKSYVARTEGLQPSWNLGYV